RRNLNIYHGWEFLKMKSKKGKKIVLAVSAGIFALNGFGFLLNTYAQEQVEQGATSIERPDLPGEYRPSGLVITPPFADIGANENYEILVSNFTDQAVSVQVRPWGFTLQNRSFTPIGAELNETIEWSDYIEVSEGSFEIPANSNYEILVRQIKLQENNVLNGLIISEKLDVQGAETRSQRGLASVMIDNSLQDRDVELIASELEPAASVGVDFSASRINLGNKFEVTSRITNNTPNKVLRGAGEIEFYFGETRIEGLSITADLTDGLYPGESLEITREFEDNRGVLSRIGEHEFRQKLVLNDREIIKQVSFTSVPYEFLIAGGVTIIVLLGVTILVIKRPRFIRKITSKKTTKNKNGKNSNRPRESLAVFGKRSGADPTATGGAGETAA
ncbi:MAG: hypothetical protein ACOCXP_00695, partial [Candidatus Dojkabacteria bacterium]